MSGLQEEVKKNLEKSDLIELIGKEHIFPHVDDALAYTRNRLSN
jgi:hypothetical protein